MSATAKRMAGSRRSRFRRSPTGKRIELTERDLHILHWLHRYRYLNTHQLVRVLQPKSRKRFVERLGDLFHETGLIDRPLARNGRSGFLFGPMIHEITDAGIDLLAQRQIEMHRVVTFSRRNTQRRHMAHSMLIIETLLAIELETMQTTGRRFVPVDEILARAPETVRNARNPLAVPITIQPGDGVPQIRRPWRTHIIPDGLYGIEYRQHGEKLYRFWALECDLATPRSRSSMTQHSSMMRKRAAYAALLSSRAYRHHWGIPNLKLHQITPGDRSV